jgi:hypothetical protein
MIIVMVLNATFNSILVVIGTDCICSWNEPPYDHYYDGPDTLTIMPIKRLNVTSISAVELRPR